MKILIVHNRYQQPGGEDAVVDSEYAMLKNFNHETFLYERNNSEINLLSFPGKLHTLFQIGWSQKTYTEIKKIIREFKPDIAHFHNIFFLITPSAYYACHQEGIPVVQSQHNFRLLCSNGLFFRNNNICEECLEKKSLLWGVYHRCYQHSYLLTAAFVKILSDHWKLGTWTRMIDRYIVGSEFVRQKYILGGIPPSKIVVKPNFVNFRDKSLAQSSKKEVYVLYAGRLSAEKGVKLLLEAWERISDIPLKIIGNGPLAAELNRMAQLKNLGQVQFLGYLSSDRYERCLSEAALTVIPSLCYENFPRILVESYALGIPVVASDQGSLKELVSEHKTGLLFRRGDSVDLAQKVHWLLNHPEELGEMGRRARVIYEQRYQIHTNYSFLMEIYNRTLGDYRSHP